MTVGYKPRDLTDYVEADRIALAAQALKKKLEDKRLADAKEAGAIVSAALILKNKIAEKATALKRRKKKVN